MPYIWIDYGSYNVISPKVYMKFEDCVKSIWDRVKENPDDFRYYDFCEGSSETCEEKGWCIYRFYNNYDCEFQIHWVDIV